MKLRRSIVMSAFLAFGSIGPCVGQQPCLTKKDVLLVKDKPTVYLSIDRDKRPSVSQRPFSKAEGKVDNLGPTNNSADLVWLRLHNNTRWPISFVTDASFSETSERSREQICISRGIDVLLDGTTTSLPYQVEALPDYGMKYVVEGKIVTDFSTAPVPVLQPPANRTTDWLLPGHSLLFAVRKEHLLNNLMIFIKFNFEWENDGEDRVYNEPQHRVYFRGIDIPK